MTVSVLFEGTLKSGEQDVFTELCREAFKVTRAYDGCQTIDLTYNTEDENNWVLTETWDSKEQYEKYVAFRVEDGTVEAISSLCKDAPSIKIYDIVVV
ncbi:MAG: antibiotic biosynthesis monooxygenase [Pseudomonadales bacterium]|nr:antibiotic biosynthesis monooxygenase [Pseudomonadales bacterium]